MNIQDWLGHKTIPQISFNEKIRELKEIELGVEDKRTDWYESVLIYPIELDEKKSSKKNPKALRRKIRNYASRSSSTN